MRSRLLMPKPQVALQGSHSLHSDNTQLLGAAGTTEHVSFISYAINHKL